jgi:hypothetical protein
MVGQVRHDVVRPDVRPAVRDVLGMDERDAVDVLVEGQQHGAGQPVEVSACHESHD